MMYRHMSMEAAAFCAARWASGERQVDIARSLEATGASTVSVAIERFLNRFQPGARRYPRDNPWNAGKLVAQGDERKALVRDALANFVAWRAP